ncbi:MAG: hypothetical protein ACTHLE_04790 [Agriterribacter sp.]
MTNWKTIRTELWWVHQRLLIAVSDAAARNWAHEWKRQITGGISIRCLQIGPDL